MKIQIILCSFTILIVFNLLGCSSSERTRFRAQNEGNLNIEQKESIGMSNPSASYCIRLGYKYKIVQDDKGGQYGVCIFPDNSECKGWSFYRGKCGQQWSFCTQCGYELKNLGRWEGWIKGVTCIDKTTKEEIGTVYDLFVRNPLP